MSLEINFLTRVPMTADEVTTRVNDGVCPCDLGMVGACKEGGLRDCTVTDNLAHVWAIAWAFLQAGELEILWTDNDFLFAKAFRLA